MTDPEHYERFVVDKSRDVQRRETSINGEFFAYAITTVCESCYGYEELAWISTWVDSTRPSATIGLKDDSQAGGTVTVQVIAMTLSSTTGPSHSVRARRSCASDGSPACAPAVQGRGTCTSTVRPLATLPSSKRGSGTEPRPSVPDRALTSPAGVAVKRSPDTTPPWHGSPLAVTASQRSVSLA